jgi:hypothetical protein
LERGRWGVAARVVVVGCKNLRKVEMGGAAKRDKKGEGGGQNKGQQGGGCIKENKREGRLGFWGGGMKWASHRRIEINGPKPFPRLLPTPAYKSNKNSTVTDVCLLKLQTPVARDPKEKNKERINFNFSFLKIGYHTLPPLKRIRPRIPTLLSER